MAVSLVPLALVSVSAATPTAAASGPVPPGQDSFYSYSGPPPLASVAPGTVLKKRSVTLALGTARSTPVKAEQLLYRTTGQMHEPLVAVTTVLTPTVTPVLAKIVEYLSFYDGLGAACDPSYTLAGGDPGGSTNEQGADEEELLIGWYLSQGDIVTVPDFEGTDLAWMAGHRSGYGALDAIRATESYLGVGHGAKVGLSGYSGGAVAADWASELAPAYAPELDIVGVAEGGIPANYVDMFNYINGTAQYSAAIPGVLIGLSRAYGIDLNQYLSSYGRQVVQQENEVCMASVFGNYPNLTYQKLMQPKYQDIFQVPPLDQMLGDQTMGTASTHPAEPLLMAVGNSDGTGDGVMVAGDVASLARRYCAEGVPVQFQQYQGVSHEEAGAFFEPQTGPFLQARFAGVPFVSNC
ncbi:MAG TPA: lipase family protein [Acidimicrobiales bacterium]|nr:lipase family protein [Acidimicrobiales bacterium]